jgi:hypothetical protein
MWSGWLCRRYLIFPWEVVVEYFWTEGGTKGKEHLYLYLVFFVVN